MAAKSSPSPTTTPGPSPYQSVASSPTAAMVQRVSALFPSRHDRRSSAARPKRSSFGRLFSPSFSAFATLSSASPSTAASPTPFSPLGSPPSPASLFPFASRSSSQVPTPTGASLAASDPFWPATLDRECNKAASIVKSFCVDGCLAPLACLPDVALAHHPPHPSSTSMYSFSSSHTSRMSRSLEDGPQPDISPGPPHLVVQRIPPRVFQDAAAVVIFTCMRSGLWMTGSGGSGILVARRADATWSPPSAILVHTPTLSSVTALDVYDCVLVINDFATVEVLSSLPHVTLGQDVSLAIGPLIPLSLQSSTAGSSALPGSSIAPDVAHATAAYMTPTISSPYSSPPTTLPAPVFVYLKTRGQFRHFNLNGCIIAERANENERFYRHPITAADILAGNFPSFVPLPVREAAPLLDMIRAAEGRIDYDKAVVARVSVHSSVPGSGQGPGLVDLDRSGAVSPASSFGIPNADDPDPYGVLALEMAGLEIREAGAAPRCASSQFDMVLPSPTSPLFPTFFASGRRSIDTILSRSNRGSYLSSRTSRSHLTDDASFPTGTTGQQSNVYAEDDCGARSSLDNLSPLREVDESAFMSELIASGSMSELTASTVAATEMDGSRLIAVETVLPAPVHTEKHSASNSAMPLVGSKSRLSSRAPTEGFIHIDQVENVPEESDLDDVDDCHQADDEDEEEPIVVEMAAAIQPIRVTDMATPLVPGAIHAKGSLVTIRRQPPPPLPLRSPARTSCTIRTNTLSVDRTVLAVDGSSTDSEPRTPDLTINPSENASILTLDTMTLSPDSIRGPASALSTSEDDEMGAYAVAEKHVSFAYSGPGEGDWSPDLRTPVQSQHYHLFVEKLFENSLAKSAGNVRVDEVDPDVCSEAHY